MCQRRWPDRWFACVLPHNETSIATDPKEATRRHLAVEPGCACVEGREVAGDALRRARRPLWRQLHVVGARDEVPRVRSSPSTSASEARQSAARSRSRPRPTAAGPSRRRSSHWSAPVRASDILHDGVNDYPINAGGRQTLSNSAFRVNSAGNLTVDPSSGSLFVVWSDNRHGTASRTNTDVFFTTSSDRGATWSSVAAVSSAKGDQFYPWAAVGPQGVLNVSYFDRQYAPDNSLYGITLARLSAVTGRFATEEVDSGLSDPNHARWFANPSGQTAFLGDYNGLAVGADGIAHPFWTDMRRVVTVQGISGRTEDAFTAAVT